MAYGTPVIATNRGGAAEILSFVDGSLSFEPGDSEVLAKLIAKLIRDEKHYIELATNGREAVREQFSCSRYVAAIYKILHEVIHSTTQR